MEESFGSPSICADGKNFVTGSSDNTAKLKDKKEEMVTGQPPFCNYMKSTKIFSDPVNLANLQIRPIEYATSGTIILYSLTDGVMHVVDLYIGHPQPSYTVTFIYNYNLEIGL